MHNSAQLILCKDTAKYRLTETQARFYSDNLAIYIIMYKLNLPPFQPKLRATAGKATIYDALRRKFVALTPEEWVRQHFVNFLTAHKGYPAAFMANEVELHVGEKRLRCDSVLYDTALRPRMIIEYKAPTVQITQSVFDQIAAYNLLLRADYLTISNGLSHFCFKTDYDGKKYLLLNDVPNYQNL